MIVIALIQILKEFFIIILVDGFFYFSYQNPMELAAYFFSLISLLSTYFYNQSNFGSVAILFAYISLIFFLQKFKAIGVYVIAFKRTLLNSTKLFPVFFILFIGFVISFKVRSHFGVIYSKFDSLGYSLIRTITMVIGELDSSKMGLDSSQLGLESFDALPNLIIYLLFIGIMCIIFLNLFVGIAVDDIKKILDEADIQLICNHIFYVLRIQRVVFRLYTRFEFSKKILNMNFKKYNSQNLNKLLSLADSLKDKTFNYLTKEDLTINLLDPQKRLENIILNVSRETNEKLEYFENKISNKLNETESKIYDAQNRLQNLLNEFLIISENQINNLKEELKSINSFLKKDFHVIQKETSKDSISSTISIPTTICSKKTEYFSKSANESQFFAESSTTKLFNNNEKKDLINQKKDC